MEEQSTHQAVVFADVCESTKLYETLGDKRALECIERCFDILRRATEKHGGRVVKTIGDEVMCVFPEAGAAARAACEMQSRIALLEPVSGKPLAIRVGAHYGPTLERSGDLYGDAVNIAARLVSFANPGQIMTTLAIVERLPQDLKALTRSHQSFSMKGKREEIAIYELMSSGSAEVTVLVSRPVEIRTQVLLWHEGREHILEDERRTLSFGREPASDVLITDRMASRQHARVELRRDKCILVDTSSNGTYVTFEGQPEILLSREEMPLRGKGSISFGHRRADDPSEVVTFEVR
jgi:adenylate cyclase